MSMDCHYGIWNEVTQYYPEDIQYKDGMQKYLKYCKENKIDIDTIKKSRNVDDIDNIMKFLKNKNRGAR